MATKTFNLSVVGSMRDLKGLLDGSLTSFRIPDGVTTLDRDRFYNFTQLTSLDFNQVAVIPPETCRECINLANVTFTTNTTEIGEYAFYNCTKFEDTELPHTLTNIGERAFYHAGYYYSRGTHTFTMIDDVGIHTTIGSEAFYQSHLSKIDAYTNNIGYGAFQNCQSLTDVDIEIHGSLGQYAFYNCTYVENFEIKPESVITSLGNNAFYSLAYSTSTLSRNIAPFDFRNSTFTSLAANTWASNYYDGVVYFPSTLTTINGNFLNDAQGNWKLYFNSVPTVSSSSYLRNDSAGTFTVKYLFPYDQLGTASAATNWSTHTSQMIGYGSGFEAGSTLPEYVRSSGVAITWYDDASLTNVITTSSSATDIYYCTLGSSRVVAFINSIDAFDGAVTITDTNSNTYSLGDYFLLGTQLTITPSSTDPNKTILYMLTVNNTDYTSTGYATLSPTVDVNITVIYWNGTDQPILPNLADNSWTLIKLASVNNTIPSSWNVGDTKTLIYNGSTYTARLVDKTGKFTRTADGSTAYLYFELTNLLPDNEVYHSSGNNRPNQSQLLTKMNSGTIWDNFDTDLKNNLENVDVLVSQGGGSSTEGTNINVPLKLFLAREHDLYSSRTYSVTNEYNAITQDEYYQTHNTNADRKKAKLSTPTSYTAYWQMSPCSGSSDGVCTVNSSGDANGVDSGISRGVGVRFAL